MYGAEAVILNLLQAMHGGPHQAAVCVFDNVSQPNLQLYDRARALGLEAYTVRCSGQFDPQLPRALRRLVKQAGADLVHAHGYKADIYLYASARRSRVPIVATCHGWIEHDLAVKLYGMLDRLVLRRYARVAAVSEQVRRTLLEAGVRTDRISIIRNGVGAGFLQALVRSGQRESAGPLRVGVAARLGREKGVDLFLSAAAGVLAELPLTRFAVAGDGPDRAQLEAQIERLAIGGSVSLLGREEDMRSFYASLDMLVVPSRQEGLPITLLEAMASGLPVVATRVGEVPAVLRDGETGMLVDREDVPGLTRAMLSLLRDPLARARLGAAARKLVDQQFSAQRMQADYLRFYEQAMDQSTDHIMEEHHG
jgi:glycosyltransferase involved in cell wall biosynthesis